MKRASFQKLDANIKTARETDSGATEESKVDGSRKAQTSCERVLCITSPPRSPHCSRRVEGRVAGSHLEFKFQRRVR